MANTYTTLNDLFTGIADAIRLKNDSTDTLVADNFPTEIRNLNTGFDLINQNVTEIADYQFSNCTDLKSVNCCELTSIGTNAFEGCSNLKTVTLYNNLLTINENAFKSCNNLTEIYVAWKEGERDGAPWGADNATIYYESAGSVGLEYASYAGYYKVLSYEGTNTKIYIPKYYNGLPVTGISFYAFHGCTSLTSITIPDSVTSIGNSAFEDCTSLTSITLPDSVTSIDSQAFYNCSSLISINIGNSVTSIDSKAFKNCTSLTSITMPDSVISIRYSAFENTAYYHDSSNWKNHVLYIDNALIQAKTSIKGDYTIKDGTSVIADEAFRLCSGLTSITIPGSVTHIGEYTFRGCTSIPSITIPDSVIHIGNYAFSYCSSLVSVDYTGTIAQWNAITFGNAWNYETGSYTIYCTDGTITKDGTITYYTPTGGES